MLAQEQDHVAIFRAAIHCSLSRILQAKALSFNSRLGLLKLLCVFILVKIGDLDRRLRILHPVTSSWSYFIEINEVISILASNKLSVGILIAFLIKQNNTILVDAVKT